jgi:hypothetical protein
MTIQKTRRTISARRFYRRISFQHSTFGGRRRSLRRAEDQQGLKFVDEYSPSLMGFIVFLLALSLIDGFMILYLLDHGAYEFNPIMAFSLKFGPLFFMASKFLLTCFGATCLLVASNSPVFGGRIHAGDIFPAMLFLYLTAIAWSSYLYATI